MCMPVAFIYQDQSYKFSNFDHLTILLPTPMWNRNVTQ